MTALAGLRFSWAEVAGAERRTTSRQLLDELLPGSGAIRSGPCARCGGAHGPARIEGSDHVVSVAYAGARAFAAAIPRTVAYSVGIDAEQGDADAPADIERMRPGTSLREWTRVEAALKADGRGLSVDPALVRIRTSADGWTATVPGRAMPLVGVDAAGPEGFVVSVAIVPAASAAAPADRSTG
jgi:4'-phosphopantetheinyl transferase